MKKVKLPESKTLLAVRAIKQSIAHEARNSPDFYLRLNGLRAQGWRVVRIWEHDLRHEARLLGRLRRALA